MNPYDFDAPVDRRGTDSLKWEKYKGRRIFPLWVADMDFPSPPAVMGALHARVDHGIFGYTVPPAELREVLCRRMARNYHWEIAPEWIVFLPGLVTGLNVACRAVGAPDDAVLTFLPAYPPFLKAPHLSGRRLVEVALIKSRAEHWIMDFDALENALSPAVKLLLLCNPHNPTGRMYHRYELEALAGLCEKNGTVICSDEIHCDLILERGRKHLPMAAVNPQMTEKIITLMAPSKTFNIPGLGASFAVIADTDLRKRFQQVMEGIVPAVNALGFTAAMAAYTKGGKWLQALLQYLRRNRDLVEQQINAMPGLSMTHVEATYLAWIDCRAARLENPAAFFEQAGVGLSEGSDFGASGFLRLNFACRHAKLKACLTKMRQALDRHNRRRLSISNP